MIQTAGAREPATPLGPARAEEARHATLRSRVVSQAQLAAPTGTAAIKPAPHHAWHATFLDSKGPALRLPQATRMATEQRARAPGHRAEAHAQTGLTECAPIPRGPAGRRQPVLERASWDKRLATQAPARPRPLRRVLEALSVHLRLARRTVPPALTACRVISVKGAPATSMP